MQDITQATDDYAKTLPISQQAKPYADQILSIYANPNIGYSNEDTQIEQVLDQVPDNVKSELSRYIMDVMAKFLELWVQACVNVTQGNGIGNGAQPGINF
uniref:Uncharacterized protein n=1 Tax=Acrobeloides nanus TaxID=290746 RepID=A0A914DS18_9BILA